MAAQSRRQAGIVLVAALACAVLVIVAIGVLDRTVSSFSHEHFHGVRLFDALTHIVDPIPWLALLGLVASAIAALLGWRPGRWGRIVIATCLAALLAIEIKDTLKFAFGRTWPETWINNNPSWIGNGVFGFNPFHGGQGWSSFPSGHMTAITAPMAALWLTIPRWRWLFAGIVLLVAIGLLGADYHWLSDIIAGTFLGAATALGIVALVAAR